MNDEEDDDVDEVGGMMMLTMDAAMDGRAEMRDTGVGDGDDVVVDDEDATDTFLAMTASRKMRSHMSI